jgi:hypothetical protein
MRALAPVVLALSAVGCVSVWREPAEAVDMEVLDEAGARMPEAWVVTWQRSRTCPLGLLFWPVASEPAMWPDLRSTSCIRLWRLTPSGSRFIRPPSYRAWVLWGFLILPPGSYCEAWSNTEVFAAECPWGFDGQDWRGPDGRSLARARGRPELGRSSDRADNLRAARIAHVLDDPDIPREDLRDFAAMLRANLRMLEAGPPEVVEKLDALTR